MTNPDHPAFLSEPKTFYLRQPPPDCDTSFGLTKREYFAALAMQGIISGITRFRKEPEMADIIVNRPRDVAEISLLYADLLIAAFNEEKPSDPPL